MKRDTDTYKTFTTTLPEALLSELDRAAMELGVRKKDILIEAFTYWNKQRKQALLANSYAKEGLKIN
jgi:hypothetical protein